MASINRNNKNMEFPLQIKRQYAAPLDTNSVFYSLAEAQGYASSSPLSYVGQVISVVNGSNVEIYKISSRGLLEGIGGQIEVSATVSSGESKPVTGDAVYQFVKNEIANISVGTPTIVTTRPRNDIY